MAIIGCMPKGAACHIYLDKEQAAILDAIGEAMGKRRLGVPASRSQLISSAIRNFIEDCKAEEDLREAIAEAHKQLNVRKESP
jgi:metal-responsive CopG/Arc/MetJ family transcriptional regulator